MISPCLLNGLTHAHAGQHLLHVTHVGLVNSCWAAQVAFVFGGFLGQDVTFKRLTALHRTTWANAESLLRAALGLHFGHDCSEISVLTTFEACSPLSLRRLESPCMACVSLGSCYLFLINELAKIYGKPMILHDF
jgi:hypothetical protein